MMKKPLSVIKIGGNVIEDKSALKVLLDLFSTLEGHKILVHGGGKRATELGEQLGIKAELVNGRRITNAQSLEITLMVYAGLLNKEIVAQLQARACNAIGLSGADGNSIYAHKRPVKTIDFGYVGDVDGVNTATLSSLLESGLVPVFCALTHDGKGQMLNTNADTIASEIAIGMSPFYETTLYFCFEKPGVLRDVNDESSVIKTIDSGVYRELLEQEVIAGGMMPKLENCFHALENRVSKVCVGNISMLRPGVEQYTTLTL